MIRFDPNRLRRVVIKIGSSSIVKESGRVRLGFLGQLVTVLGRLHRRGIGVVLVSSGAIAMGYTRLGFKEKPGDIPSRQACAAAGQTELMSLYQKLFETNHLQTAQVLLTRDDMEDRRRYLNARETLLKLMEFSLIPIINENDSVAVEEIQYGDNDRISALVAGAVDADLLVLMTDVDGLYTTNSEGNRSLVPRIEGEMDDWLMACGPNGSLGSGGMRSKLEAAGLCRQYGIPCLIARSEGVVLDRALNGEEVGTYIVAGERRLDGRHRWLLKAAGVQGALQIDEGARKALVEGKKSLLPKGVIGVEGDFARGAVVRILDADGREVGRGVVRYNAADLSRIRKCYGHEITGILGYTFGDEVIHRDNLVLAQS